MRYATNWSIPYNLFYDCKAFMVQATSKLFLPRAYGSERYYILVREVLLKGKTQYGWPPCTNQFRSAPFYIENIINLFYKTSYLNEEVNCIEPSPLVSIPCPSLIFEPILIVLSVFSCDSKKNYSIGLWRKNWTKFRWDSKNGSQGPILWNFFTAVIYGFS